MLVRETVLTACFALPWLGSALLFRRAAQPDPQAVGASSAG
jgi:hypothetical protein